MFFKKSMHNFLSISVSVILFVCLVSSCKVATPPQLPEPAVMPETFVGNKDTTGIGELNWSDFFTDPYLVELIDIALENNLDRLSAVQRVKMARANYQKKSGALWPSLNGVLSANAENLNEHMALSEEESIPNIQEEYFLGLQSSWEVDLWGKLRNQKKAAYAQFLASEKGKQLVTTSLVAEVAQLYYDLLALDNELQVVRKNINFQEIALEVIKIQKMGGRTTELAVQQSTAQLLSTKALGKEKEQRIIELENRLNLLLGRYPQVIPRGKDISEQILPENITTGIPSQLLLRRPDIEQAELELLAAKADLEAARAAFLPSLKISPYIGLNSIKAANLLQTPQSLAMGVLGGLTAPIFNKKRIKSDFDRSVAKRAEAYYNYQQTIITGFGEVVTSLRGIENLQEVYKLKEQEADVLLKAVSTSNTLFTSGYATYLEVITAQKSVLEAELELANIKKGIFHSVIGLYRALGGGWTD